jgi:hypothetical protein
MLKENTFLSSSKQMIGVRFSRGKNIPSFKNLYINKMWFLANCGNILKAIVVHEMIYVMNSIPGDQNLQFWEPIGCQPNNCLFLDLREMQQEIRAGISSPWKCWVTCLKNY